MYMYVIYFSEPNGFGAQMYCESTDDLDSPYTMDAAVICPRAKTVMHHDAMNPQYTFIGGAHGKDLQFQFTNESPVFRLIKATPNFILEQCILTKDQSHMLVILGQPQHFLILLVKATSNTAVAYAYMERSNFAFYTFHQFVMNWDYSQFCLLFSKKPRRANIFVHRQAYFMVTFGSADLCFVGNGPRKFSLQHWLVNLENVVYKSVGICSLPGFANDVCCLSNVRDPMLLGTSNLLALYDLREKQYLGSVQFDGPWQEENSIPEIEYIHGISCPSSGHVIAVSCTFTINAFDIKHGLEFAILIFNSSTLDFISFLRYTIIRKNISRTENYPTYCFMNVLPTFSRCSSRMLMPCTKVIGDLLTWHVDLYSLPQEVNLQTFCRTAILKHCVPDDLEDLPLPQKLLQFLRFRPIT